MEAPEHFIAGGYYGYNAADFPQKPGEHFTVDDLLDLPNEDAAMSDGLCDNVLANSTDSSNFTVVDSCNSSISGGESYFSGGFGARSFGDSNFATELCVPNDDVAELEWLSNFVEDSLSFSNTAQNLQLQYSLNLVPGSKPSGPESSRPGTGPAPHSFLPETPLPSKSRSRRSRAAPCDWTTRLLHLNSKPPKAVSVSDSGENPNQEAVARRCLHCAAEKTPQWRTGPMGPKTLCNACGVRYKSGRLVPEYRPAASPTFMSTKHSNSHRKVLELRRQKEMHRVAQQHQQMLCQRSIVGVSNGYDDCLINHGGGSTYSHLI